MPYPLTESEAAGLRSEATLSQLRGQAREVVQTELLPGSPEQLWPVCAFTDLLNQAVGMQATRTSWLARESGSAWMHAETKNAGLAVAYEELPFEWEAPRRYQVERIHSKGPLKYLSFGVDLDPAEGERTRLSCRIRFVSHLPGPVAALLINKEISRFMQVFRQLAQALQAGTPALKAYFDPAPGLQAGIEAWVRDWEPIVPDVAIRQAIAGYLARAPERLAYRLRPFELARAEGLDPLAMLEACLLLSREGLLQLMWDCRCPGCKGPKESFARLGAVAAQAYCPSCAVSYGLAFDQNLELSFQPAAGLRPTSEQYFCAGSPGNTPHLSWQQNLLPGASRELALRLTPGLYVLRSLSVANELLLSLSEEHTLDQLQIEIADQFRCPAAPLAGQSPPQILELRPGARLSLRNLKAVDLTLMLENPHWRSEAVTAARVQSVQAFHDLFPDEVLGPGEALPLQAQIIFRALLQGDGGEPLGADAQSELFAWLQTRIQQHAGAVVAAADASLQAVFASPDAALAAAWDLQQELPDLNALYLAPVNLSIGIARGPCEVFGQDGRLAYRGPAPAQAEAAAAVTGQGIVIGESLLQGPEMGYYLEHPLASWQYLADPPESSERWLHCSFESAVTAPW